MKLLLIYIIILPTIIISKDIGCKSRYYGSDGNVCVCDENYCDTIERYSRNEIGNFNFIKYTTNMDGLRFFKENGTFSPATNNTTTIKNGIYINSQVEYQSIAGWGGAFTDAFGYNVQSISEATRRQLINSYFSENGIEYSLCRVPIGGTDFSLHGYSYDDVDEIDVDLKRFNLTQEDYDYKIPLIKIALNLTNNRLRLLAAAWTAPKWMKTNHKYSGFGFLIPEMYQSWANYHLKFLEMYANNGIKFWGISTGNEPSLALPFIQINSVAWLPQQMIEYVSKHLGPVLRNSTFKDIKIITLDDQRFFLPWYVEQVFNDELSRNYIDGISVHWYYDNLFPASLLSDSHKLWPDKFILATEACNGHRIFEQKVILGSWQRAEKYAKDIIEDMLNWVVGWVDWNMALDETGGPTYINNNVDSTIIVNATANEFYKQPTFYAIGHFSKFIPANSTRIHVSSNLNTKIQTVAFKTPDQQRVVVILNRLEEDAVVNLVDDSVGITNLRLTRKSITTIIY